MNRVACINHAERCCAGGHSIEWRSRLTLASTPGRSARNWVATVCRASLGHSLNQSMVVQFTRLGNLRSRSRNSPPTGLKLSTICRLRFTCMPNQCEMKMCGGNEIRPAGCVGLSWVLAEESHCVATESSLHAAFCQTAVCSKEGVPGSSPKVLMLRMLAS